MSLLFQFYNLNLIYLDKKIIKSKNKYKIFILKKIIYCDFPKLNLSKLLAYERRLTLNKKFYVIKHHKPYLTLFVSQFF